MAFAQQLARGSCWWLARHDGRAAAAILVAHRTGFGRSRNPSTDKRAELEHAPARMRLEETDLRPRAATTAIAAMGAFQMRLVCDAADRRGYRSRRQSVCENGIDELKPSQKPPETPMATQVSI
jgi:hypothetical protein